MALTMKFGPQREEDTERHRKTKKDAERRRKTQKDAERHR